MISRGDINKGSPYLLTQIAYATTTWQNPMPKIWLPQNAWISVGFFSLSSEKLQWSNSAAQSNSSKAATCISEMQMRLCCINSKAPSVPSHSCPSEMLEHLLLYSGFLYPSLTCLNSIKTLFNFDPTALHSLKIMAYFADCYLVIWLISIRCFDSST